MRSSMEKYPEISEAYSLYQTCRNQTIFEYEFEKNKKPMRMILHYTTGLTVLPYEGGVMDQPVRLMTYFEEFLAGDEEGFYQRMNRKQ